jgi:hypothetical protein
MLEYTVPTYANDIDEPPPLECVDEEEPTPQPPKKKSTLTIKKKSKVCTYKFIVVANL